MGDMLVDLQAEPSVPSAGKALLYGDSSDRYLKWKDEKGVVGQLGDHDIQNWVRNSGFWLAQRQAPASATTYSNTSGRAISADGWGITNENASATYQRTDTLGAVESGLQGQFYGNFLKTTSTGKLVVTQVLEGKDTGALRGRTVRVQFWAKQLVGATPTLRLCLVQLNASGTVDALPATYISAFGANGVDPTLGANLAYIAPKSASGLVADGGTINGNGVDCVLSAAWQRFGAVFDVPSTCKNLVIQIHGNAQFAATNGFALAQVSLTDGYEIQDWVPQDLGSEISRCQRFYQKTFELDTLPAAAVLLGALRAIVGKAAVALGVQFHWRFTVPMAKIPTVATFNPVTAANTNPRRTGGTAADETAVATANISTMSADITATDAASGAVGDAVQVQATADAEL